MKLKLFGAFILSGITLILSGCSTADIVAAGTTIAGGVLGNEIGNGKSEWVAVGGLVGYGAGKAVQNAAAKGYEKGLREGELKARGQQEMREYFSHQNHNNGGNYKTPYKTTYYNLVIDEGYVDPATGVKMDETVISLPIVE